MTLARLYLHALTPFAKASEPWLYPLPGAPGLLAYGSGYNTWGVQTNQKAFSALAVLAADPAYDAGGGGAGGVSRDELLERALGLLRFSLASHLSGESACTDGQKWGHTWISVLGVERMMHAVEAIEDYLTPRDHEALRRMLLSEADWLLDCYPVEAGPVEHNKPESNIWNGALLHRVALMYPEFPRAAAYRDKGTRFLLNGISLPEDADSDILFDGRPLREWHVGNNFFPSRALNHHRYLNVGYMVICLSNIAMLHFSFRHRGVEPPAALYHHAADLYRLIRLCTFPDGRLLRIGGDTRARYCYCQDYAIPMWLLMAHQYADGEATAFETRWLQTVEREIAHNADGTYLSDRCAVMRDASPLYYTRLESDRAAALSMGAYWRRRFDEFAPSAPIPAPVAEWHDPYHGACLARGSRRAASWVWDAAEKPTGLCVPIDRSDLAEWRENLAGKVRGEGLLDARDILAHEERLFPGGFITWGATRSASRGMVAEGQADEETAVTRIAFAALPDDATCLLIQSARTPMRRLNLRETKGLQLLIPNDLFNGNRRNYETAAGTTILDGAGSKPETLDLRSRWLVVDQRLAVALAWGADSLQIHRPGQRQITLRPQAGAGKERAGGTLYCDEIVTSCTTHTYAVDAGATLFDIGAAVRVLDTGPRAPGEPIVLGRVHVPPTSSLRALQARGADGKTYLFVANSGDEPAALAFDTETPAVPLRDIVTGECLDRGEGAVFLGAGEARLFVLEE